MPDKNGQPSPVGDAQTTKTQARTSDLVVGTCGSSKRTLVPFLSTFCETPTLVKQHFFERGELIPLEPSVFYRIERGIVCASTWDEDGKSTTLGYWGVGDIVGYPLSKVRPYHLECLNATEASIVPFEVLHQNIDALLSHIQQVEELMCIINCKRVSMRVWQFLLWLSNKFGRELEQGKLIELAITHQEIADVLNTTRVTVTRVLQQFEDEGKLQRHKRKIILAMPQKAEVGRLNCIT
ncbi:Crp/Fnr family transcriptional regulator [Hassallia byssoidea VB512170]|uniref:Crp/Fnr family transcriptional regulator n=2 Tax=Hassallia TaxID=482629 RepID=A0A846H6W9_9CYAN|nr:Crp/Fnr family transcriptional regulator [Hassalia byssoidea VB512170]